MGSWGLSLGGLWVSPDGGAALKRGALWVVSWGCWRPRWPRGGGTDSHITAPSEAGVRPGSGPGPLRPDTAAAAVPEGHHKDGALHRATPPESPPHAWLNLGRLEGILRGGEGPPCRGTAVSEGRFRRKSLPTGPRHRVPGAALRAQEDFGASRCASSPAPDPTVRPQMVPSRSCCAPRSGREVAVRTARRLPRPGSAEGEPWRSAPP